MKEIIELQTVVSEDEYIRNHLTRFEKWWYHQRAAFLIILFTTMVVFMFTLAYSLDEYVYTSIVSFGLFGLITAWQTSYTTKLNAKIRQLKINFRYKPDPFK